MAADDPALARQPYQQTYEEPTSSFQGGSYYDREGITMPPASRIGPRRGKFEFLSSKWRRLFFATAAVQAIICMAFEA